MTDGSIPLERLLLGNEHWHSYDAADEIEIYCELLDHLQDKIDALETRGKDEEVTLSNVQAVISSYAIEIAMKSLWALDHPDKPGLRTHNLVEIFDGLKDETKKSLERLQLNLQVLQDMPTPFTSNRYSMEGNGRRMSIYQTPFLREFAQLLKDKVEENREALLKSPRRYIA